MTRMQPFAACNRTRAPTLLEATGSSARLYSPQLTLHRNSGHYTSSSQPCTRQCLNLVRRAAAAAAADGQPAKNVDGAAASNRNVAPAKEKLPLQQTILNGILAISAVPYSSYVPYPVTFLHKVDAMVKQLWLVVLFVVIARSAPTVRVAVAAGIAAVTAANLPPRLWRSQLARLAALCGLIFVLTALGADGVPPVLQPRAPPAGLDSLPACPPPEAPYEYVLLHAWFITVTKRSVNMAITAATLTFSSLQAASLVLVTTPGEEMALALRRWLAPLALVGVKTQEVALTLLLSLRFMSLVFDEIRNMALGLAARGVDWKAQGSRGSLEIFGKLLGRLFGSLFDKSEKIAQAMVVRGFAGPEAHNLYMMRVNPSSVLANAVALAALAGLLAAAQFVR